MNETTALLWLDQGIWSRSDDPLIREVARSMTTRIDSVDYASKGMSPTRASNIVFNVVSYIFYYCSYNSRKLRLIINFNI